MFRGWYTDAKLKNRITAIKKTAKKNYTLYAKWEKVKVGKTTIKRVTSPKQSQVKLTVAKVSNAAGYEVLCATDKQFKKNKKLTLARSTSVTVKGLKAGKTYYVKVRA